MLFEQGNPCSVDVGGFVELADLQQRDPEAEEGLAFVIRGAYLLREGRLSPMRVYCLFGPAEPGQRSTEVAEGLALAVPVTDFLADLQVCLLGFC